MKNTLWLVLFSVTVLTGAAHAQMASTVNEVPQSTDSTILSQSFSPERSPGNAIAPPKPLQDGWLNQPWQKMAFPHRASRNTAPSQKTRKRTGFVAGLGGIGIIVVGAILTASSGAAITASPIGLDVKVPDNTQKYAGVGLMGGGAALAIWGFTR